ncbi:hypothetical protein ORIO_07800 [Cereibacter azotoformans]|uniref:DUF2802 domain-containing protein n=2 Tax=Cereibacter TaxID=1653176 RepID=A0A2T5KDC9_9RHOB|nr:hypothetical protein [Cereibacter azotoformans]AXQ93646.1 hypothetical protein D0Z66_07395 [Cereibacter sphaeroides]MBO4168582.1 hypothetical protein [Cereibacter azotoformans]PTR20428.1 hypothetical protein C8J28_102193 [Cereibacter azotoformans]UIJ31986.1 hypothetical protein LV780_07370 [Cereibacter azotoformans]ULB09818.1 hypothetical protein ORIO_07800 [Cereibacter azotoformans]
MSPLLVLSLALPLAAAGAVVIALRRRQRAVALAATAPRPIEEQLAALEQRIAERLHDMDWRHASVLDRISATTDSLQSDLDWLTGERMIEQAISLARKGEQPEAIAAEVGLDLEEARAIARLRRH